VFNTIGEKSNTQAHRCVQYRSK